MLIPKPLLQSILLPVLIAIPIGIFGKRLGKKSGWIALATLLYSTILLSLVGLEFIETLTPLSEDYLWSGLIKLTFSFIADGLSIPTAITMALMGVSITIYSIPYMEKRIHELYPEDQGSMYGIYYLNHMFLIAGLIGIALSTNTILLYLFLELTMIAAYLLMDFFGYADRHRVAIMYFIWSHVGAGLLLMGVVLTYIETGSFSISAISDLSGKPIAILVSFFIIVGLLIKMAAFGFHVWLPHVHGEHLAHVAGIIATLAGMSNYLLVRLLAINLPSVFSMFSIPLMIWALVTMVYGAFLTLAQDDTKRLYACSTISQTAYSLLGIASCTALGIVGGIFYFLSHVLGKMMLLCIAGIILHQTGLRDMNKMGGLAKTMPLTAALTVMGSMILSAIPPLSGFQAEWIMFVGIFRQGFQGSTTGLLIALIGIFATFLTLIYTFWPIKRIFFGPLPDELKNVKRAPLVMTMPLLILAIISIILGIYPDILMKFLNSAISLS